MELLRVGLGTMQAGEKPSEAWYEATMNAMRAGCRHIDTAELYSDTAPHVGRAILASGISREELFVTSKLKGMPVGESYEAVRARVEAMLSAMQLDRFDLLLIHWPGPADLDLAGDPQALLTRAPLAWFEEHIAEAWANMQRLRQDGLTKQVGVSNFYAEHVRLLKEKLAATFSGSFAPGEEQEAHLLPYANQLFIDLCHQELELVRTLQKDGIRVIGYRPICFLPVLGMAKDMGDPGQDLVEELAREAGVSSVQQLVLRWLQARGVSPVVGSTSSRHLSENFGAVAEPKSEKMPSLTDEELGLRLGALDGNETVEMCSGTDEYAMAWREIGAPPAAETEAAAA